MVKLEDIAHLPLLEGKPADILSKDDSEIFEVAEMSFKVRNNGHLQDTK